MKQGREIRLLLLSGEGERETREVNKLGMFLHSLSHKNVSRY